MASTPSVKLARPVRSIQIISGGQAPAGAAGASTVLRDVDAAALAEIAEQKVQLAESLRSVAMLSARLQQMGDRMIVDHRQAIAKLAVEIARKILVRKVEDGDYKIEQIVQEALNNAPTRQEVIVRVNGVDLARINQLQQEGSTAFAEIRFIADSGIGPGQCVVETPKGKIESLIDEHLEQISRALSKVV